VVALDLQHPDAVTATSDGNPEAAALAGDAVPLVRLPLRVDAVEEEDVGRGEGAV
jgi:hypothetical protein